MADANSSLRCQLGCWLTAAVAGLVATVIMLVVGDVSVPGSIFVGILLTVVLGAILSWLLCRPLPTLDEVRARSGSSPSAPAAPTASGATSAPAGVAPIGAAAAAEERSQDAGKGTDAPTPIGAAAAADEAAEAATGDVDYDGDGQLEGTDEGVKPPTLDAARDGGPDNLKEIKGVGPKLEKMLHSMGIFHFDQVASWGVQELAWVDANLQGFKGRASRDDWVGQAKILATGADTEFSKRVEDGDVY